MKVYRIENQRGTGMYASGDAYVMNSRQLHKHPPPHMDSPEFYYATDELKTAAGYDNVLFGFETPQQMRAWVFHPAWRKTLETYGNQISVYEVPEDHVVKGNRQVVFNRRTARLIETHPVTHMARLAA